MVRFVERTLWLFFAVLVAVTVADCVHERGRRQSEERLADTIRALGRAREEIVVARSHALDLERLVLDLEDERSQLTIDLAAALDRPAEVRTVIQTETRLIAGPVVEVAATGEDVVQEYRLGPLVVGRFSRADGVERHETIGVELRASVVVGQGEAAGLIEGRSVGSETWVMLPGRLEVLDAETPPRRVVAPSLALGVSAHLGTLWGVSRPYGDASAALLLPWLYPHRHVAMMSPRLHVSGRGVRGGLDVAGYNVGARLPIIEDLWLSGGASVGSDRSWSADLTLYTRI